MQIKIQNLTFAYDGSYDNVFENTSFAVDTDWKLGLTGRNGRGKTTLFMLLLGRHKYSGSISSPVSFEYFPYAVSDPLQMTLDIAEEILPELELWRLKKEFSLLGLDDDTVYRPFITLSKGEQTKVLLVLLFLKENRFLLIDEPTNHLDAEARVLLTRYLNTKKGFILISHDRSLLDGCTDHTMAINKTDIEVRAGNFSSWYENKVLRDNFEQAENEKLKKQIDRLADAAKRTAKWSNKAESAKFEAQDSGLKVDRGYVGHKAAKMMQRAKSIERRQDAAIAEKSALLQNIEQADSLKISQLNYHSKQLLELNHVSIKYGGKTVCQNISFSLSSGGRIALCGKNGSGKSSILKLICGENVEYEGGFYKNGQLKISYVAQDASPLSGSLTDYAREYQVDESLFKTILHKLDFGKTQFEKDMSEYSAGQKKKVLIARSLSEQAHLHIWDEPLNYIDIISRMQIEELLKAHSPSLIFVEHDAAFISNIATEIIRL